MKKLLPFVFTLICLQVFAQRKETDPYNNKAISFGPEWLIPGGSDFKIGVGASGKVEYPVTDIISVGVTAGYNRLYYKQANNDSGPLGPYSVIPVKGDAIFFLDPDIYCDLSAGAAIGVNYDKRKTLAVGFGVGYVIPVFNHQGVDVSFRFEDWGKNRLHEAVLRVAYRLAW